MSITLSIGDRYRRRNGHSIWLTMFAVLTIVTLNPAHAQQDIPPCESDSAFGWLDFWLGEWDVFVDTLKVGYNSIEKVLDGCAVTEDWMSMGGYEGRSLFYFIPATRTWKQVWVTEYALVRGGIKEKVLIKPWPDGQVRF